MILTDNMTETDFSGAGADLLLSPFPLDYLSFSLPSPIEDIIFVMRGSDRKTVYPSIRYSIASVENAAAEASTPSRWR